MSFDLILKINTQIFEDSATIDIGSSLILTPIYQSIIDQEAEIYFLNCNDIEIEKFLPSVCVRNADEAKKLLVEFLGKTALRLSLLYCIRPKNIKCQLGTSILIRLRHKQDLMIGQLIFGWVLYQEEMD